MMDDVRNGRVHTQGKVIDQITEVQQNYYEFDENDFPEPSSDGRVLVLLSYP